MPLGFNSSGLPLFDVRYKDATHNIRLAYGDDEALSTDEWHHLVATLDRYHTGTTDRMRFYVDGECVMNADRTELMGLSLASTSDLLIGAIQGKYGFSGYIDEVAIYDMALSAAEGEDHYLAGCPPVYLPGDADKSGTVDAADAAILAANWLKTSSTMASVPEPRTIILILSSLVCLSQSENVYCKIINVSSATIKTTVIFY